MNGREELRFLCAILHYHPSCDLILGWLIENRLTGRAFMDWYKFKFAPHYRAMFKYVLQRRQSSLTLVKNG